jgi:hypothetical protein
VALLLAAALVAVPLVLRGRDNTPERQAQRPDSASAATQKARTCEVGSSSEPKGYYRVRKVGKFTVAVPADWKWHRDQGRITLRGSGSGSLVIAPLDDVPSDPLPQVKAQAKAAAERIGGYQEIAVEGLTCDGNKAADWEYRSDEGHVLQRTIAYSSGTAFSLTWTAPEGSWDNELETFTTIASTFAPR